MPRRRALLLAGLPFAGLPAAWPAGAAVAASAAVAPRPLQFPADFGAHPDLRIEWWYATGWLVPADAADAAPPAFGFQLTFFRSRTAVPPDHPSAFAAHQLIFAHAAVTDLAAGQLLHDQRIARAGFGIAQAGTGDTALTLRDWRLQRQGPVQRSLYRAEVHSATAGFALQLDLAATQPVLLQGQQGWSQKGPRPELASHYYTQPQLQAAGRLLRQGRAQAVRGLAWLDHEWAGPVLDDDAVGWDWLGINLHDGSALTASRMRRADGSTLWAGGSFRPAPAAGAEPGPVRSFAAHEVEFTPLRSWTSPTTRTTYPVQWRLQTPAGRFTVNALLDAQEQDSRASTGTVYWEGLSELLDAQGRRVGYGYLELTGYQQRLRL
jgi:predicted secreted hydrolase